MQSYNCSTEQVDQEGIGNSDLTRDVFEGFGLISSFQ